LRKDCYELGRWNFEELCVLAAERYNIMIGLGGNVGAAQEEHDNIIRLAFEMKKIWEDLGDELKEMYFKKADEAYDIMMDLAFEMADFFEDMAKTPKPNETIII
jgi:hypothetical protein